MSSQKPFVFGIGLSRTGTYTLVEALETLGWDRIHSFDDLKYAHWESTQWIAIVALLRKYPNLDSITLRQKIPITQWSIDEQDAWTDISERLDHILSGFEAAVDLPTNQLWRLMYCKYPNAKFVLNIRNRERWYQSIHATISLWTNYKVSRMLTCIPPLSTVKKMLGDVIQYSTNDVLQSNCEYFDDKTKALKYFDYHLNEVTGRTHDDKGCLPSDSVLVYSVKEGWSPLCKFLDIPTPSKDTAYPWVNNNDEFEEEFLEFVRTSLLKMAVMTGFTAYFGWMCSRIRSK